MNTAAIYRQYQTYVRSDKSGWALDGCSDSALMAQAKQPGLHLEMCINRFDSGITLSRMRGGGTGAFPTEIHNFSHNCALFVMVSGQNRLQMGGREYRPSAGEIWLVRGELADVSETLLPDNGGMRALALIESGSTVQAAMHFCGYRHAGRFNEAFKRHYGFLPSDAKKC